MAISLSGGRDDNLLPPVRSIEELQVLLDGLEPGQFSGKVNGCNSGMVGVPVHLFLQRPVDLIQGAQEELWRRQRSAFG